MEKTTKKLKTKEIILKNQSLIFDEVSLIYPNGFRALRNINFDIKPGEFVALIGNSGSGKSSILTSIPAMYKISQGKIFLGNTFVSPKSSKKYIKGIRNKIGFVFQNHNIIENQMVFDNIKNGLKEQLTLKEKLTGQISSENKKRIFNSLSKVGMISLAYEKAKNLSGGQQQRVALARTLVSEPSLILADEPVSALDVINQEKVMNTFYKINKEEKITVLINLHHIDLALKYADKIIGVKDGEVVFFDSTSKITPSVIEKIYNKKVSDVTNGSIKESLEFNKKLKLTIKTKK